MSKPMAILKVALQGNIATWNMDTITNSLKAKQQIVGGLIEVFRIGYVRVKSGRSYRVKELDLILNEEGKLLHLPTTCVLESQYYYEPIAGNCFFCLADETTGEFEGLPMSLYKHLKEILMEASVCLSDDGNVILSIDTDKINQMTEDVVYE